MRKLDNQALNELFGSEWELEEGGVAVAEPPKQKQAAPQSEPEPIAEQEYEDELTTDDKLKQWWNPRVWIGGGNKRERSERATRPERSRERERTQAPERYRDFTPSRHASQRRYNRIIGSFTGTALAFGGWWVGALSSVAGLTNSGFKVNMLIAEKLRESAATMSAKDPAKADLLARAQDFANMQGWAGLLFWLAPICITAYQMAFMPTLPSLFRPTQFIDDIADFWYDLLDSPYIYAPWLVFAVFDVTTNFGGVAAALTWVSNTLPVVAISQALPHLDFKLWGMLIEFSLFTLLTLLISQAIALKTEPLLATQLSEFKKSLRRR